MTRRIRVAHAASIGVLILALVLAPAAVAGKPRKGKAGPTTSSSTLKLVLMDGATEAHYMGRVTFEVSTGATSRPYVGLRCWQGTEFVYDGYVGYFPQYPYDPWFTLGSPYWAPELPASCTARLFYFDRRGREKLLATMGFGVAP
jgi:hypothetical protein